MNNPYVFTENINNTHKKNKFLHQIYSLITYRQDQTPNIVYKDECTFPIFNFLIIGLCNSSVNSWFDKFSFLIPLPEGFSSKKNYRPLKQVHIDIHHILEF